MKKLNDNTIDEVIKEEDIPDYNIFMMCDKLNTSAFKDVPEGFHIRKLKREELETWMLFPFDTVEGDKSEYLDFMKNYFEQVYNRKSKLFFESCMVICDSQDKPIGTCFVWKSYDKFWTVHWFKVLKNQENNGLGKAILTQVLKTIPKNEFPVYLHTQPGSYRAIKIYSDFGFKILKDDFIGNRKNHYKESLKYLKYFMKGFYDDLLFEESDGKFSEVAKQSSVDEF